MREDLLHYVWKHRKLPLDGLRTTSGEPLKIIRPGSQNAYSGPDFFDARVEIGPQYWAGNVEVHVRSSDWYRHDHEDDPKYGNIILHVVWEDDVPIYRKDGVPIPTLALRTYIPPAMLLAYRQLFRKNRRAFINCARDIPALDTSLLKPWLDRMYIERLEYKARELEELLTSSRNNWEQVLFIHLLKNFGLNINGASFLSLGRALDFSIVRKLGGDPFRLESVLFGLAGLLQEAWPDPYYQALQKEYTYLRARFGLQDDPVLKPEFARLRPANFPTIRLSQFAALYTIQPHLFSRVIETTRLGQFHTLLCHTASPYWNTHYVFGSSSGPVPKKISKAFIHLLLLNCILPLKFCYAREQGRNAVEEIQNILSGIPPEKNRIVCSFAELGLAMDNAMDAQAYLHLFHQYCSKNRCLQCAVGCRLLDGK